jgi:hypothetical protein
MFLVLVWKVAKVTQLAVVAEDCRREETGAGSFPSYYPLEAPPQHCCAAFLVLITGSAEVMVRLVPMMESVAAVIEVVVAVLVEVVVVLLLVTLAALAAVLIREEVAVVGHLLWHGFQAVSTTVMVTNGWFGNGSGGPWQVAHDGDLLVAPRMVDGNPGMQADANTSFI